MTDDYILNRLFYRVSDAAVAQHDFTRWYADRQSRVAYDIGAPDEGDRLRWLRERANHFARYDSIFNPSDYAKKKAKKAAEAQHDFHVRWHWRQQKERQADAQA